MSVKERRERQKQAVRESILTAAGKIAREEGWSAVTVRRAAEVIEYTPPIIYEYFANKAALLGELQAKGFALLAAAVREASTHEVNANERILRLSDVCIPFAEQQMRRDKYPDQPKFPFVPGYDLVGTVMAVGGGAPGSLVGKRAAALTNTGGWASCILLSVEDLLPVPEGIDPADAETLIVNGIATWQMLHRTARIQCGQTIVVYGANGGVGSILGQLDRHAGVRVIGTASPRHHAALRESGVEPLDYNDPDLEKSLRLLAPGGADAVFDHVGGKGVLASYKMLAPGGTLVCHGNVSIAKEEGASVLKAFLSLIGRLACH